MRGAGLLLGLVLCATAYGATVSDADVARAMATQPSSASGFVERGNLLLAHRDYALAAADFSHALALDPHSIAALAGRGIANARRGNSEAAHDDVTAALAMDSSDLAALRGRALVSAIDRNYAAAIADWTVILQGHPDDLDALDGRSDAAFHADSYQQAADDCAAYLKQRRDNWDIYLRQFTALLRNGNPEAARAVAASVAGSDLEPARQDGLALQMYRRLGDVEGMMRAADDLVRRDPGFWSYFSRAMAREASDTAGRAADIDEIERLHGPAAMIVRLRAELLRDSGQYAAEIVALDKYLDTATNDKGEYLALRAAANAALGNMPAARSDQARAMQGSKSAQDFNAVCWNLALSARLLDGALKACDKSLQLAPNSAATLDSRGLVLLRLGKYQDSIASYDQSLQKQPWEASSLYGRGLAELRSGNPAQGSADVAKAKVLEATVDATFARYDLTP